MISIAYRQSGNSFWLMEVRSETITFCCERFEDVLCSCGHPSYAIGASDGVSDCVVHLTGDWSDS